MKKDITTPYDFLGSYNPKDYNFYDILLKLLLYHGRKYNNNDLTQLLYEMSIKQDQGLTGGQRDDWNKQLVDNLLSYQNTLENREYNENLRDEQRIYDSPTNQLARLMGAGISRDAAIQLLSGSGGSGGSGVPYSNPTALAAGLSPTQSALNEAQTMAAKVGTVFGAIGNLAGAVGALGSFGISAATLSTNLAATKAATAGQLLNNTTMSKTLQGIETASVVIGAVSQAVDAGVIAGDHDFTSAQDMVQTIRDKAPDFEPFNQLVSSGTLDKIGKDLYSMQALNSGYKSWRESRDYGIDRKHIVTMQSLNEMFNAIQIEQVQSEIIKNGAEINNIIADTLNSTNLAKSQVSLNESQRLLNLANVSNVDTQTDLLHQQYELQQLDLDWLTANVNDINSVRTNQLMLDSARWQQLTGDPKAFNAEIESWLSNRANLRTAIAIESYYYNNRKFATDQLQQQSVPFSDLNFAQMACWFHNLFAQTSLVRPGSVTQQERDQLGELSASTVAVWALRKYAHLP